MHTAHRYQLSKDENKDEEMFTGEEITERAVDNNYTMLEGKKDDNGITEIHNPVYDATGDAGDVTVSPM